MGRDVTRSRPLQAQRLQFATFAFHRLQRTLTIARAIPVYFMQTPAGGWDWGRGWRRTGTRQHLTPHPSQADPACVRCIVCKPY